jgi:hypothetical protein
MRERDPGEGMSSAYFAGAIVTFSAAVELVMFPGVVLVGKLDILVALSEVAFEVLLAD